MRFPSMLAAALLGACANTVTTFGDTGRGTTERANEFADAMCAWAAECGLVSIACDTSPCSGSVNEIRYDECYQESREQVAAALQCNPERDALLELLDECKRAFTARPCPTQADADAYAKTAEAGNEDPHLPQACLQLIPFFRCVPPEYFADSCEATEHQDATTCAVLQECSGEPMRLLGCSLSADGGWSCHCFVDGALVKSFETPVACVWSDCPFPPS
jgi:hypothetical protein